MACVCVGINYFVEIISNKMLVNVSVAFCNVLMGIFTKPCSGIRISIGRLEGLFCLMD